MAKGTCAGQEFNARGFPQGWQTRHPVLPFPDMTKRPPNAAVAGSLAPIVERLRKSFALDYEAARRSAEDMAANFLALARDAQASAEASDFARATAIAQAVCTLAENLALPDLATAGLAYAAAAAAEAATDLQATTERLMAVLATFGIADATLERPQEEDELPCAPPNAR